MTGGQDPAAGAGAGVVDLVEGRDYTVTRRPAPVKSPAPVARSGRPKRPKKTKFRLATRDPAIMVAAGLAAMAVEWFFRRSDDRDPADE